MNIPLRKEEGYYPLPPLEWEQNYAYLCKGVNQHNFLPFLRHRLAQVSIISLAPLMSKCKNQSWVVHCFLKTFRSVIFPFKKIVETFRYGFGFFLIYQILQLKLMFLSLTMGDSQVLIFYFYKGPIHVVVKVLTYQVDYQNKNISTLQLQGHVHVFKSLHLFQFF
jgi:hypothetical protein